jgi:hypothetical protein
MKTAIFVISLFSASLLVEANLLDSIFKSQQNGVNNGMATGAEVTTPYANETDMTTARPRPRPPGIRVATWNYHHVKPYLITTLFLVVVTICKLGKL